MNARPALFPQPHPDPPELSQTLTGYVDRLHIGQEAKWARINVQTIDCIECSLLQHETHGDYGPRRQAKWRRKGPLGGRLDLCRDHADAWKRRDSADSGEGK